MLLTSLQVKYEIIQIFSIYAITNFKNRVKKITPIPF